jgi:hypothetical protein
LVQSKREAARDWEKGCPKHRNPRSTMRPPVADHQHRGAGIAVRQIRHDRCIHHAKPLRTANTKFRIHNSHRISPHAARAHRVITSFRAGAAIGLDLTIGNQICPWQNLFCRGGTGERPAPRQFAGRVAHHEWPARYRTVLRSNSDRSRAARRHPRAQRTPGRGFHCATSRTADRRFRDITRSENESRIADPAWAPVGWHAALPPLHNSSKP